MQSKLCFLTPQYTEMCTNIYVYTRAYTYIFMLMAAVCVYRQQLWFRSFSQAECTLKPLQIKRIIFFLGQRKAIPIREVLLVYQKEILIQIKCDFICN